jgi:Zn-dependent protease with chaperone function
VTGLSVRELSGVLAHEFGHFAQGGGMRMTMLIRVVNAWLYRVVHERDTWDSKLEEWSKQGNWQVVLPMALARLSIWVSRQALAGVTLVGHGVSCYMLRQMEFDADSYEIKIAGTKAFTRTMVRLRELSAGSHVAYTRLRDSFENRAIPADLPLLFAEYSRRLPNEIREQVSVSLTRAPGHSIHTRQTPTASQPRRRWRRAVRCSAETNRRRHFFASSIGSRPT